MKNIYEDPHADNQRLKLHYGDLTDTSNLTRIIHEVQPDEVYNLGAQSHVAVSFEAPEYTADVDAMGTLRLLEAIRLREFLHVDDMAAASVHVMNLDRETYETNTEEMLSHINVGTGVDCTIREMAETVAKVTGFTGELTFDTTKPDGAPRKLMDVSRLASLGWTASIGLGDGLRSAYQRFLEHQQELRKS